MDFKKLQLALVGAINQVFQGAQQLDTTPIVSAATTRAVAVGHLFSQVYDALREMNQSAWRIDPATMETYIDWDEYMSLLDIYYDNGALFAVASRAGKLFRIAITVENDEPSLGEPQEIELNARTQSRVWVYREKDGRRRWISIAGSAVINRSGALDSTRLFDSFIRRANDTGKFPILSFYHEPERFSFGVADYLARDEFLYLATGYFHDDPLSQVAADGLERSTEQGEEWGNSIGFFSMGDPEMLDVGNGVAVPMYVDGVNHEISIVLERDAAALFTRMSTEEVNRMNPAVKNKFAQLVGDDLANQLDAAAAESNRTIADTGMVARAQDASVADTVTAAETLAQNETPVAQTAAPAQTRDAAPQEFEVPEEMFGALVDAIVASPALQAIATGVQALNQNFDALAPRVLALESDVSAARTTLETRVALLEREDAAKQAEWLADLAPQQTTRITLRPRDARAVNLGADGQPLPPDSQTIAQGTLSNFNSKRQTQQHA